MPNELTPLLQKLTDDVEELKKTINEFSISLLMDAKKSNLSEFEYKEFVSLLNDLENRQIRFASVLGTDVKNIYGVLDNDER